MKDYIKKVKQIIFTALSNREIVSKLAESGFDEERLREGLALCCRIEELMEHLERTHGRKLQMSFGMEGENMFPDELRNQFFL
ncbi:MAG: hypothetical protein GTO45_22325 [Candidatus Aminicenantes bacterium]|nr:hypothetical protein [Candidatus Aminicenantes bacterium]NIM81502.1 hypothetical protein [Candidatus Aminicenantes bacterium]NIN20872.1 hypothetical protein [Candidatus Aminicenantes bacterium]NIN44693.1 hypothetical protein [Candidatus Aminicenantes bacterium]NIN87501.1 hypothetical protein [Candidatus Aminicenantes bacterium]